MITLEIKRVTSHTTFLLHVGDKNYPAEMKNYAIRQGLAKTDTKTFSVEFIKGWREMLLKQSKIDIMKQPYLKDTTEIVNQLIEYFDDFR